jgi:hypothetical protein
VWLLVLNLLRIHIRILLLGEPGAGIVTESKNKNKMKNKMKNTTGARSGMDSVLITPETIPAIG